MGLARLRSFELSVLADICSLRERLLGLVLTQLNIRDHREQISVSALNVYDVWSRRI